MKKDPWIVIAIFLLLGMSIVTQLSIAPFAFPVYWYFLLFSVLLFLVFSTIDFEILRMFSWHLYIFSVVFLIIPLLIGQATRGAVRWIPIGSLTIQPAEFVRPLLILFFANYLTKERELGVKRFLKAVGLFMLPALLILVQPSLGVTVLLGVGFAGVVLAVKYDKRILLVGAIAAALLMPFSWFFLAPYQKTRVMALINPQSDPYGAGYNSIQSKISVGSGRLFGRGIGEGVQTQLSFLPERHTDFVFASIAEELGFIGAILLISLEFFLLYRIVRSSENSKSYTARAFTSGVFLTLFAQVIVHTGMNMGLFPITGLPMPLVSIGGSALMSTMIMLGMVVSARK